MPLHSVIQKEQRLVITTGEGRLTLEDVKENQHRLLSDPDFDPEFNQLLDATAITEMAITVDDIKRAVSPKVFSPTSRRAFSSGCHLRGFGGRSYKTLEAPHCPRGAVPVSTS